MYEYTVKICIDKSIESDWKKFMLEKHIQDVLDTGHFSHAAIKKIIKENESNDVEYSVEYLAASLSAIEEYREKCSPALQKDVLDKFGNQFTAEREVLIIIKSF
ncbi:MAG TPA: DUF4286 family protein [Chitinophagales bacterium]|nr:DUF4286 family protein [Chitinophagales bacterium]HNL84676.1 DUF4286 family protein [Chitinophagales bacterium]